MLKRKIDEKLLTWKDTRRTALLITGARQIGKTYSIEKFANDNFKHCITINFAKRPDLIDMFCKIKNSNDFLIRLSLVDGNSLVENETVIFLDEIQLLYKRREELIKLNNGSIFDYQDIITLMKDMSIDNKYRFILSGSLLGVTLTNIILNPLGYMDIFYMYPLDFEEYLWAKGIGNKAIDYIKECFYNRTEVDDSINEQLLKLFKEYVLIGGMPEAVESFVNNQNLKLVENIHNQIINNYLNDITTYVDNNIKKLKINDIYKAIPSELNSKNKRFISSHVLDKSYINKNDIYDDFLWLTNAYVAIPVYNVTESVTPLVLASQRKTFKLFLNDIGLLNTAMMDSDVKFKILNDEKEINFGAPYENVCAQELYAHGFNDKLFYYNSKKHGEIDFVIEYKGDVLPIEIKSGKANEQLIYNHCALNNILKTYPIKNAYVFGETNIKKESNIITLFPIYMISFIEK